MRKQITKTYEAREIYSPFGTIEFLDIGEGAPVLVSHGTMGGWDHGYLLADRLLGLGYRLIVPSRFGYLKSSMPGKSDFETQADCFSYLLDTLGIDNAAVLGLSAGGVPAMSMALRHADKVTGLILVSTALQQASDHGNQTLPVSPKIYEWFIQSDLRFRLLLRFSPKRVQSALGMTKENVAVLDPDEHDFAQLFTEAFLPVSARYKGWLNDSKHLSMSQVLPLERISAPTLVISAEDDNLAPHGWSRLVSEKIPGAKLLVHTKGGHLILGNTKIHRHKLRNFIETSRIEARQNDHCRDGCIAL